MVEFLAYSVALSGLVLSPYEITANSEGSHEEVHEAYYIYDGLVR